MQNQKTPNRMAIGSLIWSVLVGAALLIGLRLMQVVSGSGHAAAFPMELAGFYGGVEALLAPVLFGIIQRRSWAAPALTLLLVAVLVTTILSLRSGAWAPDFWPTAFGSEAIWLGPWVVTTWGLRIGPPQKKPVL